MDYKKTLVEIDNCFNKFNHKISIIDFYMKTETFLYIEETSINIFKITKQLSEISQIVNLLYKQLTNIYILNNNLTKDLKNIICFTVKKNLLSCKIAIMNLSKEEICWILLKRNFLKLIIIKQ